MNFDDIVWKYPRYKMESAKLIVGSKEPFDIKMSVINTLYLKRNFEDEYFPYFEISISVPYWVYNRMGLLMRDTRETILCPFKCFSITHSTMITTIK